MKSMAQSFRELEVGISWVRNVKFYRVDFSNDLDADCRGNVAIFTMLVAVYHGLGIGDVLQLPR